jgi:hypothetical protein
MEPLLIVSCDSRAEMQPELSAECVEVRAESTWPKTLDCRRAALRDVPEDEARQILGENAVGFVRLDRTSRCRRPTHRAPAGRAPRLPCRLRPVVAVFDERSGYLEPVEKVDTPKTDDAAREDLTRSAAAR